MMVEVEIRGICFLASTRLDMQNGTLFVYTDEKVAGLLPYELTEGMAVDIRIGKEARYKGVADYNTYYSDGQGIGFKDVKGVYA